MANHTVRVQLVGVEVGDEAYYTLHSEMEARGFTRTIFGEDRKKYALPTGSYSFVGDKDGAAVRDLADEAVRVTRQKSRILVTTGVRCWTRLEEA